MHSLESQVEYLINLAISLAEDGFSLEELKLLKNAELKQKLYIYRLFPNKILIKDKITQPNRIIQVDAEGNVKFLPYEDEEERYKDNIEDIINSNEQEIINEVKTQAGLINNSSKKGVSAQRQRRIEQDKPQNRSSKMKKDEMEREQERSVAKKIFGEKSEKIKDGLKKSQAIGSYMKKVGVGFLGSTAVQKLSNLVSPAVNIGQANKRNKNQDIEK